MNKVKIIIADDHKIFTNSLRLLLELDENLEVIDEVFDGEELVKSIEKNKVDIVLLDINMPLKNGLEVLGYFQKRKNAPKFIVISMFSDSAVLKKVEKLGASAHLPKNLGREELMDAIYTIHNTKGVEIVNITNENNIDDVFNLLTKKEKEILKEISLGLNNQEIADKYFCSLFTIQTHRRNIHTKLSIKGQTGLLNYIHNNSYRI